MKTVRYLLDKIEPYKSGLAEGVGIIGAIIALVGLFFPGEMLGAVKYALIGLLVVAVSLVALIRRGRHLMPLPEGRAVYFLNMPCTPAELDAAIEIAQHYFGADSMQPAIVRAAYRANPYSFIVIKDASNKVVGYFDHFGLKKRSFDRFIKGTLTESQMTEKDFLTTSEIAKADRIYIGGIALRTKSKYEAGKLTKCLLKIGCDLLLERYLKSDREIELYATGFTKEGTSVLLALGFGKTADATGRDDNASLFWRKVSRKAALKYRKENPLCKSEIMLTWETHGKAESPRQRLSA